MVASSYPIGEIVSESNDVAELALLVPGWQVAALEDAAHAAGLTAGQFLRRLLDRALCQRHTYPEFCADNWVG